MLNVSVSQKAVRFCRQNVIPLALAIPALVIGIAGDSLVIPLRYDREAILAGEIWRFLTANIAHLGWPHLIMNLASLTLIWMLFGKSLNTASWAAISLISSLFVTFGLILLSPMTGWYVGLSGMLHGLFIAGIFANIAKGYKFEYILLAAVIGKLLWEQKYGPLPGSESFAGGKVIVSSHLYGAVAGLVFGAYILIRPKPAQIDNEETLD